MRAFPVLLAATVFLAACDGRPYHERLPAAGMAVPAFDLPLVDGGRATGAQLAGAPTLIALWSSSCSASRLALRALDEVQRDYAARGVRVLVVADDGDRAHLRAFMDSVGVDLPVALAAGEVNDLFDVSRRPWDRSFGLPSWVVVGADGRVAETTMGVPQEEVENDRVRLAHVREALDRVLRTAP